MTFEYKEPDKQGRNAAGPQRGFIAQDVEKLFPQWVGEGSDGFKTLTIRPAELAALEVESIRTLKTENDALKAETTLLRERVSTLEHDVGPRVSGFDLNGLGFGVGGIALAGALIITRRRSERQPKQA